MKLDSVPCFRELLERRDLTPLDALVYGALAEFEARGHQPSAIEIGEAVGRTQDDARRLIRRLCAAGLVRREENPGGQGARARYTLLGPRVDSRSTVSAA